MTVEDATAFTLFGTVVTGEQIGVGGELQACEYLASAPQSQRIALPLI